VHPNHDRREKIDMSMFMTRQDVNSLLEFATIAAAKKAGIPHPDLQNSTQLRNQIQQMNPSLSKKLLAFINAYEAWFDFSVALEDSGQAGKMDSAQQGQHRQLMDNRDATRNDLIDALK
jgi:hypothetical protein